MHLAAARRFSTALASTCLAAAVAAQQPAQPPTFRTRVDLVQVDVVVLDENGNHVRGLTASDFEVFDRKKPQTIAAFDEVSHTRADERAAPAFPPTLRMDVASNRTAQADRLVVMVIDDLHIYKGRTDRARELAREIVGQLGPQASMAVLFTSGGNSTEVTEDRSVLLAAVETLKARQSWRRPHQAIDRQRVGPIDPEADIGSVLKRIDAAQNATLQEFFENMTQYKTLQDAARMIGAGDVRRKAFVMVSEGIGKDLTGVFDSAVTPSEARCPQCVGYHDIALHQMMESMRRSNVATYIIDPRGHVSPQQLALEAFPSVVSGLGDDPASGGFRWDNPIRQAQDGLTIMAEASGGFAVTDTDDFTSGLGRIIEDLDHYYLLGFYPAEPKGRGYRPLDVRIPGHPEWTLRFRKGYQPGGPPPEPKNRNPLVALSAGVMPKTDLPLRLTAIPLPGEGRTARVALALEVSAPVQALQDADDRLRDDLKYEVLAVNAKRSKVTSVFSLHGRLTLSPADRRRARPDTVIYQVGETIQLAPGRYQLRVSAMSAKLAKGGSVYLDIEVPDFQAAPLGISGLAVGYADGPRVPTAPLSTPRPAGRGRPAPRPASPLPFPPSLDREFSTADTLRVYFEVAAKDPRAPLRVTIDVLDAGNRVVQSQAPPSESGRVDVPIPLAAIPPGAYIVRATVSDRTTTAARDLGFVVR
jgi:VWFA-related protein